MSGDTSFPLSCSACVVRRSKCFLKGFFFVLIVIFIFPRINMEDVGCAQYAVIFKMESEAMKVVQERTLCHITFQLFLFIYPLVEVFCNLLVSGYLIPHYLFLSKNFSRPYRRVQSYV